MKRLFLLLAALAPAALGQDAKPNFSGTWDRTLNSELGEAVQKLVFVKK